MEGIQWKDVVDDEQIDEETAPANDTQEKLSNLANLKQNSNSSNSQMNQNQNLSGGIEKEDEARTPKANLRQARINDTRPVLVVTDTKSVTTVPSVSQISEKEIANGTLDGGFISFQNNSDSLILTNNTG